MASSDPALGPFTEAVWKRYPDYQADAPLIAHIAWGDVVLDDEGPRTRRRAPGHGPSSSSRWRVLVAEALVSANDPAALPRFLDRQYA